MAAASEGGIQPEATDKLRGALSYLAGLQQFGMEIHSTIEVVMEDGQKLEFHFANDVTVQRPNKLYSRRIGSVADEEFFYDGETLGLHYPSAGFYAMLEAPDTLEGMLDFARESLDIVAPAGDFLYANAYEILMQDVHTAFEVPGLAFVEGVACDHLAFSLPGTDFQVWIQQREQPLLRRLVITSRDIVSAPQFTVSIRNWDLNPEVSADLFKMTPADEAKNIEFIVIEQEGN
jgi:hypothetical protein